METQIIIKSALIAVSYFLGGIPTGYLIARKAKGIDIRRHGSGNPGAANVYRTVGARAGWITFLIDACKGFICVRAAFVFFPDDYILAIICGAVAICGHMWTIYLRFKGGKGVATSAGVFAALVPVPTLIAFIVFAFFVWLSGHISVGSVAAAITIITSSFFIGDYPWQLKVMITIICSVVIYKHIPNMKRLLAHKELAFEDGAKKKEPGNENK